MTLTVTLTLTVTRTVTPTQTVTLTVTPTLTLTLTMTMATRLNQVMQWKTSYQNNYTYFIERVKVVGVFVFFIWHAHTIVGNITSPMIN